MGPRVPLLNSQPRTHMYIYIYIHIACIYIYIHTYIVFFYQFYLYNIYVYPSLLHCLSLSAHVSMALESQHCHEASRAFPLTGFFVRCTDGTSVEVATVNAGRTSHSNKLKRKSLDTLGEEKGLTAPTPHISKKYAPKICHKMRGHMAQKSLEIKGLSQRMWYTNRLLRQTNSDFYGIQTPTFTPYEPFLLGVGVVFNILS